MRGNPDIAINCQGFSNIYFHKIVATVEGSFTLNIRIIYFKNFLNGFFCKYTLGEEEGIGEDCYFFFSSWQYVSKDFTLICKNREIQLKLIHKS